MSACIQYFICGKETVNSELAYLFYVIRLLCYN